MSVRGRPTKYDPLTLPARAEAWAKRGLTLEQIATHLGLGRATLVRWKARYPELAAALQAGWEEAADRLVASLYRQALGVEYIDIRVRLGRQGGLTITRTHRSRQPRYRAVALWLSKHCPETWGPRPR